MARIMLMEKTSFEQGELDVVMLNHQSIFIFQSPNFDPALY